VTTVGTLIINS